MCLKEIISSKRAREKVAYMYLSRFGWDIIISLKHHDNQNDLQIYGKC